MECLVHEENNFSDVIDNLMNMFGNVMSKDVISAVVESCSGDLNLSVDAIMNITSDGNVINNPVAKHENMPSTELIQPSTSFAAAAQSAPNTGAIPKCIPRQNQPTVSSWTDQIRDIIINHNQGNRILILMRGVPGSGKSCLAQQLIDMTIGATYLNYRTHIMSTDDYFMVRGQYQYEKFKLPEAHRWNQNRVRDATRQGLSPIIVDNTNIEVWEMEPYLREGVKNGYIIQVVEPTTPWAKKASQLFRRNIHNVPLANIKRMLANYIEDVTGESLRQTYRLSYPVDMVPPVRRTLPPFSKEEQPVSHPIDKKPSTTTMIAHNVSNIQLLPLPTPTLNIQTQQVLQIENPELPKGEQILTPHVETNEEENKSEPKDFFINDECDDLTMEEQVKHKLYLEAQKRLEEIEKVDRAWENGENWDSEDQGAASENLDGNCTVASNILASTISTSQSESVVIKAKPQRKPGPTSDYESAESLMQTTINHCKDWSEISMFMAPWVVPTEPLSSMVDQDVTVETISSGTCMEIGDKEDTGKNKVITATPRNINEFHISLNHEKIPQKRMLDKSSMTNEGLITEAFRCSNEEKHFIAFRKLFKNIARSDLRDIFDKCCGDVNWSVEIVLDGMNNNQFKTVDVEELSDAEEESSEQCVCLASYNIIPDVTSSDVGQPTPKEDKVPATVGSITSLPQKKKRDITMSDENVQIKRQIEQNVVISDNHYSKHCLKIRKMRRGEPDTSGDNLEEPNNPGTSADASAFETNNYSPCNFDESDDDDNFNVGENEDEKIVTINLGTAFIKELDKMFGREDMQYPTHIQPRVSLPMSTLNVINAVWMESLMFQLDEHAEQTAAMVQQDEEFARQIAMKDAELSLAGKEPEVPDFKEIMDMDLALDMYQKDVAEWRNNMPTDLAAKMSRDKLYNLFPDVAQDTLSELLMAHDNNFKGTVEVLLMSTGRADVLEAENGVNKFIAESELQQKDMILQQTKKELAEADWPLLSKEHDKVDMTTVEAYREEADQHLARRNLNYQKAQDYMRRGMTQVASYYSEIANFHKQKYEQANSLAAASLMQYHSLNNPDCMTIDLHYLRVKEAKESLDIFIDTHISKLRDSGNRRSANLFFITGRGKNSQGRARIKPATIHRLKERGLGHVMQNPGLLSAKVDVDTKLTYQVSVP